LIADDLQAMLVLLILRELKIKVPEDVSIVAFNNTIISRLSSPPLTSVNIQTYQLGYEATRCLIEQIKEPDSSK
ncbi:substrate-binding domain-containing protein, partial [Bifidobacterium thermophilum]|nr:substrate-binding domain-containing protein [Bifidobacterium thermophilum]